jgi:hypothetical protein
MFKDEEIKARIIIMNNSINNLKQIKYLFIIKI